LNAAEPAIIDIRHAIEAVLADHDGVEAGLTGIDVMESDETAVAIRDSTMSSIIALVLISALLIAAFRMVRTPLLCAAALLVGISWTFGYLTFAIGHLQILSVVFVAILLGLGIDFGIHLAAAMQHAPRTMPVRTAWAHAFRETGPGMLTGAATTAAAFAITAFTDFRGVAEMGMIASVGILLCLVAMYLVLPALMTLGGKHEKHIGSIHDVEIDVFREGWLTVIATHPRTTLAVTLAITALGVVGASKLRFSADLVALQADHSPSVQWQQRIVERTGTSVWYAVSIADSFDEARERAEAFRGFFSVSRIAGAGALFPEDAALKDIAIAETRLVLAEGLQVHPKMFPEEAMPLADALNGLARNAGRGNSVAPESLSASIEALESSASRAALLVSEACPTCLQEISSGYAKVRSELFAQIGGLLDESPVGPGDLPEDLIGSFLDTSGGETRYAIEIFPELPESVQSPLDPAFLGGFMDDVTSIDPNATGVIAQVYYSSAVIRESFIRAGLLALVVVAVMVFCVFRSVSDAALCLFPVIVGFVLTFGILAATGRSIDLANIIVLPLMFGIGIDAGVHVIHRARAAPTARPVGLTGGTGKAITLTSLTTATGFAAMMLASHRGIAGLGFTLSVGIILTLLACLTILPAMLELRARRLEHQIRSAESC
ncbi:MAG: MMPL family transporter, partial [Planctomycetota bacterium]